MEKDRHRATCDQSGGPILDRSGKLWWRSLRGDELKSTEMARALTASELHSDVWRQGVVIEAIVPVGVGHEDWRDVREGTRGGQGYGPLLWA